VSGFENFAREAQDIERALEMHGIALGIDWNDSAAVRVLAAEALKSQPAHIRALVLSKEPASRAKGEIFALSNLMLKLMAESAGVGVHTHGGCAWKSFARALYALTETKSRTAPK